MGPNSIRLGFTTNNMTLAVRFWIEDSVNDNNGLGDLRDGLRNGRSASNHGGRIVKFSRPTRKPVSLEKCKRKVMRAALRESFLDTTPREEGNHQINRSFRRRNRDVNAGIQTFLRGSLNDVITPVKFLLNRETEDNNRLTPFI